MADGFKTRNELVAEALSLLGVLASGQSPSAEDSDTVDDQVEPTLATLRTLEMVEIDDPDEIPDEVFNPIAAILAENNLVKFGIVGEERGRINEIAVTARRDLLVMISSGPTYETADVDYF